MGPYDCKQITYTQTHHLPRSRRQEARQGGRRRGVVDGRKRGSHISSTSVTRCGGGVHQTRGASSLYMELINRSKGRRTIGTNTRSQDTELHGRKTVAGPSNVVVISPLPNGPPRDDWYGRIYVDQTILKRNVECTSSVRHKDERNADGSNDCFYFNDWVNEKQQKLTK